MEEKHGSKKRLSVRTKWTIVVIVGFVLLGVVSGLLNQRIGDRYSFGAVDEAARDLVGVEE